MCVHCGEIEAYFAGFFDGEGHVHIREAIRTNGRTVKKYVSVELHVGIGNVEAEPLILGQARWGGRLYVEMNPRRTKPIHRWHLSGQMAARFLADVFPFLHVKKDQAAFALELQDRIDAIKDHKPRSTEEMAERYRLRDAIKGLNARRYYGPKPNLRAVGGACLHCGCGQKSNRHGNQDAITIGDLHKAMQTGAHKESGKGPSATASETGRMIRRHARRAQER